MTLSAKVDALLALKPTVEWLRTTVQDVEESLTFLNAQYDPVIAEVEAQKEATVTKGMGENVGALQATVSERANTLRLAASSRT